MSRHKDKCFDISVKCFIYPSTCERSSVMDILLQLVFLLSLVLLCGWTDTTGQRMREHQVSRRPAGAGRGALL